MNNQSTWNGAPVAGSFLRGTLFSITNPVQPDFVKLAEGYGIQVVIKLIIEEEAKAVFEEAFLYREPVLIDCRVSQKENVYPMIAPGKGLHRNDWGETMKRIITATVINRSGVLNRVTGLMIKKAIQH